MSFIPSAQERRRIATLAIMPERTVLRVYQDPGHRKPAVFLRVKRAAAELGIIEPAAPAPPDRGSP